MNKPKINWPDSYYTLVHLTFVHDDLAKFGSLFPHKRDPRDRSIQIAYPSIANSFELFQCALDRNHQDCVLIPFFLNGDIPDRHQSPLLLQTVLEKQGNPLKAILAVRDKVDPNTISYFSHLDGEEQFLSSLNSVANHNPISENGATLLMTYHPFETDWELALHYLLSKRNDNNPFLQALDKEDEISRKD
jgi:hypothetical protein